MQKTDVRIPSTFVGAWVSSMKIHDVMGENRIRFALKLNEMSDELSNLVKEVDKTRKQVDMIRPHTIWIRSPTHPPPFLDEGPFHTI
jgi:hypothetical protein